MPLPPPFPTAAQADSLHHDLELQKTLDLFGQKPLVARASFAVADFSRPVASYAAWNPHTVRYSGSVLKIAAMFAAYQLRERVNLAARGLKKDAIFRTVTAEWYRLVARKVAGPENFPLLDEIFTPRDGAVDFAKKFADDLGKMITDSDTEASGQCIRKLGHQYINGALAEDGLYSTRQGGMWLGGDYNAIEYQHVKGDATHYAATPVALLRFLNLLHQGRLVSFDASEEMKGLMSNFYTRRFLDRWGEGYLPMQSYGKLGWGEVGGVKTFFDTAVIRRWDDGGIWRYAIVMLGLSFDALERLAKVLDGTMNSWQEQPKRALQHN